MKDLFKNLDLNLLRVFEALVQESNVTRAAARLSLSQPAVSNALNRLREAFDDPLFEKSQSGVQATATAIELWTTLKPHYEALRGVLSPESFDPQTFTGQFTIAMSDYSLERILPRLAARLACAAPALRMDVVQYSIADLNTALEKHGVDFAIGGYSNDTGHRGGIHVQPLWPVQFSCLMRRDHPLNVDNVPLADFLAARHVEVILPGMHLSPYDQLLSSQGLQRNLVLTLSSFLHALAVIHYTGYVGILPTSLLDTSPHADALVSREPPVRMPIREFGLIWHRRNDSVPVHAWLRKEIIALFADE